MDGKILPRPVLFLQYTPLYAELWTEATLLVPHVSVQLQTMKL